VSGLTNFLIVSKTSNNMAAIIIDSDSCKTEILGYDPARAEDFHRESAKMADQKYEQMIKNPGIKQVVMLCGGSASGKSEFVDAYLVDEYNEDTIILDSTLSTSIGAKIKIKKALKQNLKVIVYFVQPQSINLAYFAFLGRERQFPVEHFIRTHSGARDTFLFVLKKYSEIKGVYIFSYLSGDQTQSQFQEVALSRSEIILAIEQEQLTIEEITNII
jgi:hypothetical protein